MRRTIIIGASVVVVAWMVSCDLITSAANDGECDPVPVVCDDVRPTEGPLIIQSSVVAGRPTELHLFRGDFELNDKILDTTITSGGLSLILPADQYYSVVAVYVKTNGDTIVAIDGDDVDVNSDTYCGGVECFEVDPARIDVLLK